MLCTARITCSDRTKVLTCKCRVAPTEQQRKQQRGLAETCGSEVESGPQLTSCWLVAGAGGAVQVLC